ncbi:MAG: conjugal transfer protein TraH [Rhodospirillaceae bacterium]
MPPKQKPTRGRQPGSKNQPKPPPSSDPETEALDTDQPPPLGTAETQMSPPPPHKSPVLERLAIPRRPPPDCRCAACPHSLWLTTSNEVKAFCRLMHLISWTSQERMKTVTDCDGPTSA